MPLRALRETSRWWFVFVRTFRECTRKFEFISRMGAALLALAMRPSARAFVQWPVRRQYLLNWRQAGISLHISIPPTHVVSGSAGENQGMLFQRSLCQPSAFKNAIEPMLAVNWQCSGTPSEPSFEWHSSCRWGFLVLLHSTFRTIRTESRRDTSR